MDMEWLPILAIDDACLSESDILLAKVKSLYLGQPLFNELCTFLLDSAFHIIACLYSALAELTPEIVAFNEFAILCNVRVELLDNEINKFQTLTVKRFHQPSYHMNTYRRQ